MTKRLLCMPYCHARAKKNRIMSVCSKLLHIYRWINPLNNNDIMPCLRIINHNTKKKTIWEFSGILKKINL